jgi:AraC-like DNA-binding protein
MNFAVESLDQPVVTHYPDASVSIVVCLPSGTLSVAGPRLTATYSAGSPGTRLRLRLPLGAALPVPPASLVDTVVSTDAAELLRIVAEAPRETLVSQAMQLLTTYGVRETAARLHVSERHLRSVFTETAGLAPKAYARIERVRSALDRLADGDLARLATEVGYYDQSHLTNEFRAVMGITPAAFAAGRRPPPAPCASLGRWPRRGEAATAR